MKYNGDLSSLEREGVTFTPVNNEYAIVTIRQNLIPWLADQVQIEYVEKTKRLLFSVDQGRTASCINGLEGEPYRLTGRDVLVAFIGSGEGVIIMPS